MPNNEGVVHNKHYKYKKIKAKFFFIYLKFVFEYSKNNQYFKDSINAIFFTFKKDYKILNRLTKSTFKKDIYFYKKLKEFLIEKVLYISIKIYFKKKGYNKYTIIPNFILYK